MLTWRYVELCPDPFNVIDVEEGFLPFLYVRGAPLTKALVIMLLPNHQEEITQRAPGESEEIAQFFHGRRAVALISVEDEQSRCQLVRIRG